ncbi:hypothetical protein TNCV_1334291 [Trichonephila clavipes]|nr:hypothetical protein TNCV_1334291 [Trichonephila clavipes]
MPRRRVSWCITALTSNTPAETALTQFSAEVKLQSSSHMAGLQPYSGSQVMLESQAMKESIKKPSRELS